MKKNLSATVDRFEEEKAVLKFADGQTLNVPIACLPENIGEGSVLSVYFGEEDKAVTEEKNEQAKNLLNEILKVNN